MIPTCLLLYFQSKPYTIQINQAGNGTHADFANQFTESANGTAKVKLQDYTSNTWHAEMEYQGGYLQREIPSCKYIYTLKIKVQGMYVHMYNNVHGYVGLEVCMYICIIMYMGMSVWRYVKHEGSQF